MGYYSNFEFELYGAVVDNPKALVEEINNADIYQVWKEPENRLIFKGNELIDIERDEYCDKFYDSDMFAEILSKHLKAGKIHLFFTGEDGEEWSYTIYPQYVLNKQIDEITPFDIEDIMNLNPEIRSPILKDLNNYLEQEKQRIKEIEKAIKFGAGENNYKYAVEVQSEETRRVVCNNIIYCKTKQEAEETKKYIEENGLVGIDIDEVEDIDVLDSWNEEYYLDDIEIREI